MDWQPIERRPTAAIKGTGNMTPETKQILMHAHDAVVQLRRQIAEVAPKAEAYDALLAVITRLAPARSQGAGEDVAWRIKRHLEANPVEKADSASDD